VWLAVASILLFALFLPSGKLVEVASIPVSRTLGWAGRILVIASGISAISSLVTGLISIIKSRERSILAFLVLIAGFFFSLFALAFIGEEGLAPKPAPIPAQSVSPLSYGVTVSVGQSLTFTAAAQDPDRNLRTLEWWVMQRGVGDTWKVEKRVNLAGSQARESFERTFPDAGVFYVKALFTTASGRQGGKDWCVTVKPP
jgi:hypothetical protein